MFYSQEEVFGIAYRVAVFPHPSAPGYFSYHSEIGSEFVINPIDASRGTSIGCYGKASEAYRWGVFHAEDHIVESQAETESVK